jgi:hypothetical protein
VAAGTPFLSAADTDWSSDLAGGLGRCSSLTGRLRPHPPYGSGLQWATATAAPERDRDSQRRRPQIEPVRPPERDRAVAGKVKTWVGVGLCGLLMGIFVIMFAGMNHGERALLGNDLALLMVVLVILRSSLVGSLFA